MKTVRTRLRDCKDTIIFDTNKFIFICPVFVGKNYPLRNTYRLYLLLIRNLTYPLFILSVIYFTDWQFRYLAVFHYQLWRCFITNFCRIYILFLRHFVANLIYFWDRILRFIYYIGEICRL